MSNLYHLAFWSFIYLFLKLEYNETTINAWTLDKATVNTAWFRETYSLLVSHSLIV